MAVIDKKVQRARRHARIRKKISGTAERPRFCVSMTSSLDPKFKAENARPNMAGAVLLGKLAAEAAKAANVTEVVFDRCGYKYHGRMKAIAETARENGLKF